MAKGEPLRAVLAELFKVVASVAERGGRISAHHLEFDAVIIENEFRRAGLDSFQRCDLWADIVKSGFCAMSHSIGHWVCQQKGPIESKPVNLDDLAKVLAPRLVPSTEHAKKHWHTLRSLRRRTRDQRK